MYFPSYRMRRLRQSEQIRNLVRETDLLPDRLIYPMFVTHGENKRIEMESMPGCYQQSINHLVEEAREVGSSASQGFCCSASRRRRTMPAPAPMTRRA